MSKRLTRGARLLVTLSVFFLLSSYLKGTVVVSFDDPAYKKLGVYKVDGLMQWDNSWTYNGQPTSATNYPTNYELQLSATISLFTPVVHSNALFINIENVQGTHFGSAFGATFTALTLTGIQLQNQFIANQPFSYSGNFAAPNEALQGTTSGLCGSSTTTPLTSTPGWAATTGSQGILIQTASGATNGLTQQWGCIYGDFRIVNSAVFTLQFDPNVNHKQLHADDINVASSSGLV